MADKKICRVTVKDEAYCYVTGLHGDHIEFLWKEFGPFKDGFQYSHLYKLGRWDGRVRFFDKSGKTRLRLIEQILPFVERWGYEIQLHDERSYDEPPSERITVDHFSDHGVKLREYQAETVNALLDCGDGISLIATGGGKTVVIAALCDVYSRAGYPTLTIVPSVDLINQTVEWYERVGLDVGSYHGANKDVDHANVVSTWQSLQNNPHIIERFKMVIVDEAQGTQGVTLQTLLNDHGKHLPFRFGCTGTIPKSKVDEMSVLSTLGPVRKEVSGAWLIEQGYLATVEIEPIEIAQESVKEEFPDYSAERAFVSKSKSRMELIADVIINKAEQYGNTLVLVNSIPFGEKLQKMIKDSVFLYGATETDVRKANYELFAARNDIIVIASVGIASVGISIDRIFCLCLVDAGKSFVRALQSIGRGLRMADDKKSVHVADIYAKLKFSRKHASERKKYYTEASYPVLPLVKLKLEDE